jgi:hypothetical protein
MRRRQGLGQYSLSWRRRHLSAGGVAIYCKRQDDSGQRRWKLALATHRPDLAAVSLALGLRALSLRTIALFVWLSAALVNTRIPNVTPDLAASKGMAAKT